MAMHILLSALDLNPDDPVLLNELGVVYLRVGRVDDAFAVLERGAEKIVAMLGEGSTGGAIGMEVRRESCWVGMIS